MPYKWARGWRRAGLQEEEEGEVVGRVAGGASPARPASSSPPPSTEVRLRRSGMEGRLWVHLPVLLGVKGGKRDNDRVKQVEGEGSEER